MNSPNILVFFIAVDKINMFIIDHKLSLLRLTKRNQVALQIKLIGFDMIGTSVMKNVNAGQMLSVSCKQFLLLHGLWSQYSNPYKHTTLKRRGNDRFHVVSTWNPGSVFVEMNRHLFL